MEKDIIEFLKYYIGQKIMTPAGEIERLVVIGLLGNNEQKYRALPGGTSFTRPWQQGNKLILRRLDSMTKEEAIECASLSEWHEHFFNPKAEKTEYGDWVVTWANGHEKQNVTGDLFWCPEQFDWLCKKALTFSN